MVVSFHSVYTAVELTMDKKLICKVNVQVDKKSIILTKIE